MLLTRLAWGLSLIIYCLLIYALSDRSHLPVGLLFNGQDKLIHAAAYAGMACLFWQIWKGWLSWQLLLLLTLLFCSLYGLTDEWHQSYVPGRDASVYDWLADTAGALLLAGILYKKRTLKVVN